MTDKMFYYLGDKLPFRLKVIDLLLEIKVLEPLTDILEKSDIDQVVKVYAINELLKIGIDLR